VLWPYIRKAAYRLIEEHPCDLYVSVHPVVNAPMLRALGPDDPEYITVVTDLVSTHAFWYHHLADRVLVPTEPARQRGLMHGLQPDQVEVVGLPVADRFCHPTDSRRTTRARLGWPQDLPVILLMGGGEGMGPLEKTANAIASSGLKATLVVVTGHNRRLKARLEDTPWSLPVFIYGFVREMPEFMLAADVMVTKAGPGTISESFIAGLPIIMYSRMPGQEDGNVTYVVDEGAGIWAPQPEEVVAALHEWLTDPASRCRAVAACHRLARPNASREIANQIARKVGICKVEEGINADPRRQLG
jgi:1,2-diacylglycerol 3-beta-galactosyltransferase